LRSRPYYWIWEFEDCIVVQALLSESIFVQGPHDSGALSFG
jgi:hypothetical protein